MFKRIIIHWSAGTYEVGKLERLHYHLIIAGNGDIVVGVPLGRNERPLQPGYALHTLHCNTESIGVAIACCAGAREKPLDFGKYPPTKEQLSSLVHAIYRLCKRYNIPIDEQHVLTHGEVQKNLGIKQRGKWDLNYLPRINGTGGDFIRWTVKSISANLTGE